MIPELIPLGHFSYSIVIFGHLMFLALPGYVIILLFWMIFLTSSGLFLSTKNLMFMPPWLLFMLSLGHSLTYPFCLFNATTAVNL
jgi:hypothetical protein